MARNGCRFERWNAEALNCALEYAVYLDDLDHDVDGSEELERLMEPLGGIVAPEVPQGWEARLVSVLVWKSAHSWRGVMLGFR